MTDKSEKGPSPESIKKLRDILALNVNDGVTELVWGSDLKYTEILPNHKRALKKLNEAISKIRVWKSHYKY